MPRDVNGNYTLPEPDAVGGDPIEAAWANSQFSDIAQAITDSVSKSGNGNFAVPVKTTDGSAAAPSFSFTNQANSGLYRAASSDLRMAVGGADTMRWTSAGRPQIKIGASWENISYEGSVEVLPVGTVNQILVNSGTAWVPTTIPGAGFMPVGLVPGDILYWTGSSWYPAPAPSGDGDPVDPLPAGTLGQILLHNGTAFAAVTDIDIQAGDFTTSGDGIFGSLNATTVTASTFAGQGIVQAVTFTGGASRTNTAYVDVDAALALTLAAGTYLFEAVIAVERVGGGNIQVRLNHESGDASYQGVQDQGGATGYTFDSTGGLEFSEFDSGLAAIPQSFKGILTCVAEVEVRLQVKMTTATSYTNRFATMQAVKVA